MRFVTTAADEKFQGIIGFWERRVRACGLVPLVYDIGGLGRGTSLGFDLPGFENFRRHGYYVSLGGGSYKSRAVHKPAIIRRAFRDIEAPVLYLDADAFLRGVPSRMEGDWDLCVTVRPAGEQDRTGDELRAYFGHLNAGVIWFNHTPASQAFVSEWQLRTLEEMNDQRALNLMCGDARVNQVVTVLLRDGGSVRVMSLPTAVYNNYYRDGVSRAAVVHLKNNQWIGKSEEELAQRCRVIPDAPMPVRERFGLWRRLFGRSPR